ncbi:MAG: Vitamin K epoxide reductase [candidate division WWE3 bacterium GW2011_GWF2_41_45]|uniref:Vitamin K epoxide reductase n=2 Tax=Katanobacteria TaxID=422282 RepID=A0A0G0XZY1_UNCKA|nr:MAG: Vitamin K epoxide reductase [candidate division WWE3 bacterium GW2011_GWC2_41_23]KKS09997.1 MAG: Vitamin K epoxide reductase [candidate division WWE3 bacterium GW2011_GWF2_41_45]KKS11957.1 MAG: Vitamin K epoxide reductase [candidate division WWE3 bacterium GW2011_GWF1_41_53]KKS19847.1 MAG: Vitamin K epoxide reductase [candidate division WWE3 bacterium GW2011_GWE1_41_72]KKS28028.1 MAG: vitamin K epoxide reductase [candidate division WWE3 bacterium GW2011_GWC1_42_102]KKS28525.1 MAG: Vita
MTTSKYLFTAKILAAIGIGLALYLYVSFITQPVYSLCTISDTINCDAVISGEVSRTLGIPTSLYGLIGYIVILVAAFLGRKKLMLGVAIFGTLFCLRITFIEIFQIGVICPVCLLCQVDMLALLTVSYFALKKKNAAIQTSEIESV